MPSSEGLIWFEKHIYLQKIFFLSFQFTVQANLIFTKGEQQKLKNQVFVKFEENAFTYLLDFGRQILDKKGGVVNTRV